MDKKQVLKLIEKEIDRRLTSNDKVHNEDLIHFLMADYRFEEKKARKYVKLYASFFTEDAEYEE